MRNASSCVAQQLDVLPTAAEDPVAAPGLSRVARWTGCRDRGHSIALLPLHTEPLVRAPHGARFEKGTYDQIECETKAKRTLR